MEAKVSVILCSYNSAKQLRRAIDCLINQTLKEIEIILVNDGSTDETLEIMQDYQEKDERVKVVSHENMGLGPARNTGLEAATAQYVTFMDADDTLDHDCYRYCYEKSNNGFYDAVIYNHNRIFPNKIISNVREMRNQSLDLNKIGLSEYVWKYMFSYRHEYGVWNKLFKREIIEKNHVRFPSNDEVLYEDILFVLQFMCFCSNIYEINKGFYNYYINSGSLSDMTKSGLKMPYKFPVLANKYREFVCSSSLENQLGDTIAPFYYSLVFFGLIRVKRFGHVDISGFTRILSGFPFFSENMQEISKFSVRWKFITKTARGLSPFKSMPLIGLCWLTLVQGGLIAKNALRGNYSKVDSLM